MITGRAAGDGLERRRGVMWTVRRRREGIVRGRQGGQVYLRGETEEIRGGCACEVAATTCYADGIMHERLHLEHSREIAELPE